MKPSNLVGRFDLDLALRDASLDPHNRATRRMLAAAAIAPQKGQRWGGPITRAVELREAIEWVHDGHPGGPS